MKRTIAPALDAVLEWPIASSRMAKGARNAVNVWCQARRELRAVKAVVRAAERHRDWSLNSHRGSPRESFAALDRALSRLHGERRGTKP